MPKKTPGSTLTPLTDEQVHELAMGILQNHIFTDRHIQKGDMRLLPNIFMPLALLEKKDVLRMQRKERPGMFYAKWNEAGPRSLNGYPMFFSVSMCSEADTQKVWAEYERLTKAAQPVE